MRVLRILSLIAMLTALALIPSTASAAPKKVMLAFSTTAPSVVEGNTTATITVTRSGNRTPAVDVDYATSVPPSGLVATPGSAGDYDAVSGTLHFATNQTSRTF